MAEKISNILVHICYVYNILVSKYKQNSQFKDTEILV
jgi:hypothetical protein